VSHLNLFTIPPTDDLDDYVSSHDLVWVSGGSVANLLAVWRVHGLDDALSRAWQEGVVLGGRRRRRSPAVSPGQSAASISTL
jgi:peptidase E